MSDEDFEQLLRRLKEFPEERLKYQELVRLKKWDELKKSYGIFQTITLPQLDTAHERIFNCKHSQVWRGVQPNKP